MIIVVSLLSTKELCNLLQINNFGPKEQKKKKKEKKVDYQNSRVLFYSSGWIKAELHV